MSLYFMNIQIIHYGLTMTVLAAVEPVGLALPAVKTIMSVQSVTCTGRSLCFNGPCIQKRTYCTLEHFGIKSMVKVKAFSDGRQYKSCPTNSILEHKHVWNHIDNA